MGAFDEDFSVAAELFTEAFGTTVAISRGPQTTAGVTVEPYQNDYTVEEADGLVTVMSIRDFLVLVTDYVIGGRVVAPQRGDRFTETIGGVEYVFEAAPLPGMPVAQWTDTDGGKWLVHTKKVT